MTRVTELLGIAHPIIQAPMAGGPTTPALVAAVSGAGALGSFGFAYTEPEAMRAAVRALREQGDLPFNINLFTHPMPPEPDSTEVAEALEALAPLYRLLDAIPPESVPPPWAPPLEAQIEAALELRPALFSFHFHPPSRELVARFQGQGARVAGSATSPAEAETLAALGVDLVIAQGYEAGGHRASFQGDPAAPGLDTLSLVGEIAAAVDIPVVAAGGIMDGADIARALEAGAAAVQMGTAFLACPESGASDAYKRALLAWSSRGTAFTRSFSGRPARALRNRFVETMAGAPVLPFPAQNEATGPLRAAAARLGDAELLSLWAGQGLPRLRPLPAAELVATLVEEMQAGAG
jgi:nitronate monooxygenase